MRQFKNLLAIIFIIAIAYPLLAIVLPGCGGGGSSGGGFTITSPANNPSTPTSTPTPSSTAKYAYVVSGLSAIDIYNADTFTFAKTMGAGYLSMPDRMCLSRATKRDVTNNLPKYLYVANGPNVKRFNLSTQDIDTVWGTAGAVQGIGIQDVDISANDQYLYSSDVLKVIVTNTQTKIDTAEIKPTTNDALGDFALTPNGQYGVLPDGTSFFDPTYYLPIANLSNNTVIQPILETDTITANVAIEPSGNYAYLTTGPNNKIIILDIRNISNCQVVGSINFGTRATGIAITPNSAYAYVTLKNANKVSVLQLNGASTAELIRIDVDGTPVYPGISSDGNYVWVPCSSTGKIYVIKTSDNSIYKTFTNTQGPWSIVVE